MGLREAKAGASNAGCSVGPVGLASRMQGPHCVDTHPAAGNASQSFPFLCHLWFFYFMANVSFFWEKKFCQKYVMHVNKSYVSS